MRRLLPYLLLVLISLSGIGRATAQSRKAECVQTEIHFRWDSAQLDTAYLTNSASLRHLAEQVAALDPSAIDSVVIVSYASPEGTQRHNERLAARRAATMQRYITEHYPALTDRLQVSARGESWAQLRSRILGDKRLSDASIA